MSSRDIRKQEQDLAEEDLLDVPRRGPEDAGLVRGGGEVAGGTKKKSSFDPVGGFAQRGAEEHLELAAALPLLLGLGPGEQSVGIGAPV